MKISGAKNSPMPSTDPWAPTTAFMPRIAATAIPDNNMKAVDIPSHFGMESRCQGNVNTPEKYQSFGTRSEGGSGGIVDCTSKYVDSAWGRTTVLPMPNSPVSSCQGSGTGIGAAGAGMTCVTSQSGHIISWPTWSSLWCNRAEHTGHTKRKYSSPAADLAPVDSSARTEYPSSATVRFADEERR